MAAFEGAGVAGGDLIDVSEIDANTAQAGNQAFAFGGTGIGRLSVVELRQPTPLSAATSTRTPPSSSSW